MNQIAVGQVCKELDNLGRAVRRFIFGGSRRPVVSAKPAVQTPKYDEFDNIVCSGDAKGNMVEWSSSSLATERVMEPRYRGDSLLKFSIATRVTASTRRDMARAASAVERGAAAVAISGDSACAREQRTDGFHQVEWGTPTSLSSTVPHASSSWSLAAWKSWQ